MWSERSGLMNAAIVGAFLAALAGVAVLAWAVASPGQEDELPLTNATTDDHLVYLLGPDEITVVDPETREIVGTIAAEYNPEFALAPNGAAIYLTDAGGGVKMLYVIVARDGAVTLQRPAPNRIDTIGVGSNGMAVSADGRYVYIQKWEILDGRYEGRNGYSAPSTDEWLDVFDTVAEEFSGSTPRVPDCGINGIFPPLNEGAALTVLCARTDTLVFVDMESQEITGSISSTDVTSAEMCDEADLDFDAAAQAPDGTIYVVTKYGCIRGVDPTTATVTSAFDLDIPVDWNAFSRTVALSPSGERLLLGIRSGGSGSAEAWVVDLAGQSVLSTFPLEPSAWHFAVSPDGSLLYVVSQESTLAAFEIATGREAWRMTALNAPEVGRVAPRP